MTKPGWSEEVDMTIGGTMVTAKYEFSAFMAGGHGRRGLKTDPNIEEGLMILQTNPKSYKTSEKVLKMCWERVRELQDEMSPFRDD